MGRRAPPLAGGVVGGARLRLLLLLTVAATVALAEEATYPEEVHRLVLQRLEERGASSRGTWGAWTEWSPCTRSCGGGVTTQSRRCRQLSSSAERQRGRWSRCVGRYKRFQLCNVQACPGPPQDYRRQQCQQYNRTPFNARTYEWEPYLESTAPCALNCRAVGHNFYATLNASVVDGTPCGAPRPPAVCVAGKCLEVGCDGVLGSGRREDACGVCGGDGSSCRSVQGTFRRRTLAPGYALVLSLPRGAANISVMQDAPSPNVLALRDALRDAVVVRGGRLPNGTAAPLAEAGGATFGYRGPRGAAGDSITARGPLLHPVDVLLFVTAPNVGVHYHYQLPPLPPSGDSPSRQPPYVLSDNPLNPIVPPAPSSQALSFPVNDEQTAPEKQTSSEERARSLPSTSHTHKSKKKKKKHAKNGRRPPPYKWESRDFSPCSASCGGGMQVSHTTCVRRRRHTDVPEQNCYSLPRPAPHAVPCNTQPCPPRWEAGEWGECNVPCGVGLQTRTVSCRQPLANTTAAAAAALNDTQCSEPHSLPHVQVCQQPACDAEPTWQVGEWGACSSTCGLGTRRRLVSCVAAGRRVGAALCPLPRPPDQLMCDMGSCAAHTWFMSSWSSTCSASCGLGTQTRRLHCSAHPLHPEPRCDPQQRPPTSRACDGVGGCGGQWVTGEWSTCTAECGGAGTQQRLVACVTWGRRRHRIAEDETPCAGGAPRPTSLRTCHTSCEPQWFTSEWSQCTVSCGGGVQRREVKCLDDQLQPSLLCPAAAKPDTRQPCAPHACAEEATQLESRISNEVDREDLESDTLGQFAEAAQPRPERVLAPQGWCVDRMKNCNLVFKARLCRLKYYSKLCCSTCAPPLS